ncbi:MAG: multidrug efflux RND transporter outer membrane subunit OpmB [Candidatus Acidiferrum sp.]
MNRSIPFLSLLTLAAIFFAQGCTVGPKYQRASAPLPAKWDVQEPWRVSTPIDSADKGAWWIAFHDEDLTALETQALSANQTLKVAMAHYQQARASAAVQVAQDFPTLSSAPLIERQRLSANRPSSSNFPASGTVSQTNVSLPFTVSYEVDLFGRRRRAIEAAQASYQATAADLQNVQLIVTAELAADYFTLRQIDTELAILKNTVDALEKGLDLVNSRHQGGISSGLEVAQEETLINTTRTQAALLLQQRKQLEDAIAVLAGKPAPDFHLLSKELAAEPPALDPALPSDLLERRPDISEAEREMAVANARIGLAKAAYYPSLNLFGQGGWQAADIARLANIQSTFWAVGANVAETIFSGGARHAQVQFAQAGYDASVATYRGAVLNALREVQDGLAGLTLLDQAQRSQSQAIAAAKRTLDIATSRYNGGLVGYLDVVNAQQNLLNSQRQSASIQGQRLVTSVLLVKALGGGWDASSLAALQVKSKLKDALAP